VHHDIGGLQPPDSARLFLRRAQRPLRWEELIAPGGASSSAVVSAMSKVDVTDLRSQVILSQATDAEVLKFVAEHPVVAAQRGNPRKLIELASRIGPGQRSLLDLIPGPPHQVAPPELVEPPSQHLPDLPPPSAEPQAAPFSSSASSCGQQQDIPLLHELGHVFGVSLNRQDSDTQPLLRPRAHPRGAHQLV
jgi:hypothetical protein